MQDSVVMAQAIFVYPQDKVVIAIIPLGPCEPHA